MSIRSDHGLWRFLIRLDERLAALILRPSMWGPPVAVELQVLHLLELRQLAIDPGLPKGDEKWIQRRWIALIREVCSDALPGLAAPWLETQERTGELSGMLERLCTEVRAQMDGPDQTPMPWKDRDEAQHYAYH